MRETVSETVRETQWAGGGHSTLPSRTNAPVDTQLSTTLSASSLNTSTPGTSSVDAWTVQLFALTG
jgi:hypothetical protein